MYPSYINAYRNGRLKALIEQTSLMLESCCICPRQCRINRLKGEKGFCKTGRKSRVYSFLSHHGEEPPISGIHGSGTIFFSGCNMGCVYCQNYEFSQSQQGQEVSPEELAKMMLELQARHCHNINLVTPTHVMPQILEALPLAIAGGLKIPLVYNTGGYELAPIIKLLDGIVDIYLPDERYADEEMAVKYSSAPNYPEYNQEALKEMQRQVGTAKIDPQGIIKQGLIIRHLVLPNNVSGTEKVMRFIAQEISCETYISLMSQYFPCYKAGQFKDICRRITSGEYQGAQDRMREYHLECGWTQQEAGQERFAGTNIKPSA